MSYILPGKTIDLIDLCHVGGHDPRECGYCVEAVPSFGDTKESELIQRLKTDNSIAN